MQGHQDLKHVLYDLAQALAIVSESALLGQMALHSCTKLNNHNMKCEDQ